ncbi:hypothetical protein AADZ91_10830 [Colwelliaceae bacterium 6441]
MKTTINVLEKIGCCHTLRDEVLINGVDVMNKQGIEKNLSLALLTNNRQKIIDLMHINTIRCCYITVPSNVCICSTLVFVSNDLAA